MMHSNVDEILQRYIALHPDEAKRQARLVAYLEQTPPADRIRRDNFVGHLTASGIVIDPQRRRVLLIHHVGLDLWLQPGGHVEAADETLLAAARREVIEETGLPAESLVPVDRSEPADALPIDVDSHDIPARPSKNELAHVHHDFRYAFIVRDAEHALTAQLAEVHDAKWWPLDEAAAKTDLAGVMAKVERLLAGDSLESVTP